MAADCEIRVAYPDGVALPRDTEHTEGDIDVIIPGAEIGVGPKPKALFRLPVLLESARSRDCLR